MSKNFESTRNKNIKVTASEAIIKGLASDGGLFVRTDIKDLKLELNDLIGKNYKELAKAIFSKFLDDYTEEQIDYCLDNIYNNQFEVQEITPIKKIGNNYILELFHKQKDTSKDIELSTLAYFFQEALDINSIQEKVIVLVATSGDAGSAAINGFKNMDNLKVIALYPNEGISKIQTKQIKSHEGKNIYVYGVNGNFDDIQSEIKKILNDKNINQLLKEEGYILSSANSLNIGRIIYQIVPYYRAYLKLLEKNEIVLGEKINFVIPAGNFGSVFAGYCAKLMGLPINKLVCASNDNHVLCDFIRTGIYNINKPFFKTISSSIDILISNDLERMLYHISGNNNEYVNQLMNQLDDIGEYKVSEEIKKEIKETFAASYLCDDRTYEIIKTIYEENNYLLAPHTAVAYGVMEEYDRKYPGYKSVVLSKTDPYCFSCCIHKSLFNKTYKDELKTLKELSRKTKICVSKNLLDLKDKKERHKKTINKGEIKKIIDLAL